MWGNIIGTAILFVLMVILFRLWEDRRTGGAVLVPMVRCNICGYPYHGLAMDCFCTCARPATLYGRTTVGRDAATAGITADSGGPGD